VTLEEHRQVQEAWEIWPGATEEDVDSMLALARQRHGSERVWEALDACKRKALTEQITVAYFWGVLRTMERERGVSPSVRSKEAPPADVADSYVMHKVQTYETDVDDMTPEQKRSLFRHLARGCERGGKGPA
jgi:hypothetical protein